MTLPTAAAWCGVTAAPCVDATLALLAWAWRSGARLRMLSVGVPVAAFVLWQLEQTVLQQVFGRLTWI